MNKQKNKKKWLFVALCVLIAVAVIIALVVVVTSKLSGMPTFIFGKTVLWVETGSMEPAIPAQSYVLMRKTDGKNLSKGDVITYICRDETQAVFGKLITHRIVDITVGGYITAGDAAVGSDKLTVSCEDVVAVYEKNLPVLTFFGRIFSGWVGFALLAVLFFITVSVYFADIVKTVSGEDDETIRQQKQQEIQRRIDEEVARLMQQKEQNSQQGDDKK